MGQVWQATDTQLKRHVALKILPDTFAEDPDRLARFQREAQLLATLNHPNIAQIHGIEEAEGTKALVLELVEGPTLADRIAQGAIPIDDALPIAKQIAEALEAAHEAGVIHRDLKPANIKIKPDGTVKVLDFGLAKAMPTLSPWGEGRGEGEDPSLSPTLTAAATQMGVILGTAAYMSPEQAKGRIVDKRTDVWAFGCVLYEMLTGRAAFAGEDVSEILASVLKDTTDLSLLPEHLHPSVRTLVKQCLAKDARRRLRDIGDAVLDLEQAIDHTVDVARAVTSEVALRRTSVSPVVAGATLVGLLVGAIGVAILRNPDPAEERVVDLVVPYIGLSDYSPEISPDGRSLAYTRSSEQGRQLWIRSLDTGRIRALPDTDNAMHVWWKPDSQSLAFVNRGGELRRLDLESGVVRTLTTGVDPNGQGSWSDNGTILFRVNLSEVGRVEEGGGARQDVPVSGVGGELHGLEFLPDGRHFLVSSLNTSAAPRDYSVYLGQLDSPDTRRLLETDSVARLARPDRVLFTVQNVLYAQALDGLDLGGEPWPIGEVATRVIPVSVSATGSLVYLPAANEGGRQFAWHDRAGTLLERVGPGFSSRTGEPELSPDETRVLFDTTRSGEAENLWLLELARGGIASQLTFETTFAAKGTWSPDGSRIAFFSERHGSFDLFSIPSDGVGSEEELLVVPDTNLWITDWHEEVLIISHSGDIWSLTLSDDRPFVPVVESAGRENSGQLSPDGAWIAYQSDRDGTSQIYLQRFPGPGGLQRVSLDGGAQVRWNSNAEELFYIALDGRLMSAPLRWSDDRTTVEPSVPVPLFQTQVGDVVTNRGQQYDVSGDGERFLMNSMQATSSTLRLILNWNRHGS